MTLETGASTTDRARLLGTAALPGQDVAAVDAGSAMLNAVLTEAEAAQLTSLSIRTLQRLAEDGRGPPRIQLTERRVGYWKHDVLAWLAARTAPAKHNAA